MADRVLSAPPHRAASHDDPPATARGRAGVALQRHAAERAPPALAPAVASALAAAAWLPAASTGQPLAEALRRDLEPRFGHGFAAVRLHLGAGAAQAAAALQARAYTAGPHIVFGAGQFSPQTAAGRRLLAHELAHVVQQGLAPRQHGAGAALVRQRAPVWPARAPLDDSCGSALAPEAELDAAQWRRCVARGRLDADRSGELRFAVSGEILSPDRLLAWAVGSASQEAALKARLLHSREFAGTPEVRQLGWTVLAQALATESLASRRETVRELQLMEVEVRRQQGVAADAQARREQRAAWIGGQGSHRDDLLPTPRSAPWQGRDGRVGFQTVADTGNGELATLTFRDADAYGEDVGRRLHKLLADCEQQRDQVALDLQLDRRVVDESWDEAAWYQKPGLALAGMGYSGSDIANALNALRYIARARQAALAGLTALAAGRGSPAGRQLNEALRDYLNARHWYHRMHVTREANDEARLGRLENVSRAGDLATMALPPGTGLLLGRAKSAAVRISVMHSDPQASFGWGSYLRESAADVVSYKLQTGIAGKTPGYGRLVVSNAVSTQTAKAIASGDPAQLFQVDKTDLAMFFGAAALEHGARKWQAWRAGRPAAAAGEAHATEPPQARERAAPPDPAPARANEASRAHDPPLATEPSARPGHHLEVDQRGIALCSPRPCPLVREVYRRELTDPRYRELESLLTDLEKARLKDPGGTARKMRTLEKRLAELAARTDVMAALPTVASAAQRQRLQALLDLGIGLDLDTLAAMKRRVAGARDSAAVERYIGDLEDYVLGANTRRNQAQMARRVDPDIDRGIEHNRPALNVSQRKQRALQSGAQDFALDHPLTLDIDEGRAVGGLTARGDPVARAEAMRRALDPNERQFLDRMTNRRSKHRGDASTSAPQRPAVSLKTDPAAVLTRRFGEVVEMKAVFDQALARVPGLGQLSPGQAKQAINREIHDIIRGGKSAEGQAVRDALRSQGFDYVADVGLAAVKR